MNPTKIETMARDLMGYYGLNDWRFTFDNAKKRHGQCRYSQKIISFSKYGIKLPMESILDTILHEIAHALTGYQAGHGEVWRQKAISIGCNGNRTESENLIVQAKYTIKCEVCGHSWTKNRLNPSALAISWHKVCGRMSQGKLTYSINV